jgi:hypothetical protein
MVRPLTAGELSAADGSRAKSRPVQRATPFLVPIHKVPSGATASWPTLASGTLRGSPARGMKRVTVPFVANRCRPPSDVPNHIVPSRIEAIDQTSSLPICGFDLRS